MLVWGVSAGSLISLIGWRNYTRVNTNSQFLNQQKRISRFRSVVHWYRMDCDPTTLAFICFFCIILGHVMGWDTHTPHSTSYILFRFSSLINIENARFRPSNHVFTRRACHIKLHLSTLLFRHLKVMGVFQKQLCFGIRKLWKCTPLDVLGKIKALGVVLKGFFMIRNGSRWKSGFSGLRRGWRETSPQTECLKYFEDS